MGYETNKTQSLLKELLVCVHKEAKERERGRNERREQERRGEERKKIIVQGNAHRFQLKMKV